MNLWIFGIIDIFILIILICIVIYGFKKGFVEQFINFISHFVGFIFSLLFAQPFANILKGLTLGQSLKQKLDLYFISKSPQISETIILNDEALKSSIDALGFPKFIDSFLFNSLKNTFSSDNIENTLLNHLSPFLVNIILVVLAFFILFFGTKVLFLIIKLLMKYFKNLSFIRFIDSLFGVVFAIFKYYIFLTLVFAILCLLLQIDAVYNSIYLFLETDMQLTTEKFRLSKFLYESNLIIKIIEIFF